MKATNYAIYGWTSNSTSPSYCAASFSGVPGCSNYNLGANACVNVTLGDLFDACGASGGCGDLECGTQYVFRAFAHNVPGGANRSDYSNTANCSTLPCAGDQGCTLTQGYWKTHGPDGCRTGNNTNNWPQSALDNALTIGGITYTADQLCSYLNTPAGGTNLALFHQLVAALLNQADGASVPADVQACIAYAQTYFTTHTLGAAIDGAENTQCLTDYNEGATGPGHCDDPADE